MHVRGFDVRKIERVRQAPAALDEEVRAVLAGARTWLRELLSIWPVSVRHQVVLWIHSRPGDTGAGARPRAQFEEQSGEVAAQVRKIRRDTPVVIELVGGRTVVVPWRSVAAA